MNIFDEIALKRNIKLTRWEKFKLFFVRKQKIINNKENCIIEYKFMDGTIFINSIDRIKICESENDYLDCPHMKCIYDDMDGETWECQKSGCDHRYKLYYDEMR